MRARKIFVIITVVLCFLGAASAADYVRMDVDHGFAEKRYFEIPFYFMHESSEPAMLTEGINGFVITKVWEAYDELFSIVPNPSFPGDIYYSLDGWDNEAPDTLLVGFTSETGVPITTTEQLYFTIVMHLGYMGGEMCFDSSWIAPTSEWVWSGPGGSIVPDFLNMNGEGGSPHCIEVWSFPCVGPVITVAPPDDELVGYPACGDLTFEFTAAFPLGLPLTEPIQFAVAFGPGTATATSDSTCLYTCDPLPAGTYLVELEAFACGRLDYHAFDVIFLDGEPPLGDCDCSGDVDIDDVVYLIAYIFSGGPEPHANPDCQGEVDIDDVVYLIYYIFSGGPAPCG